jgi:hypothetical protein
MVLISTLTYTLAIYMTSFPVVMMVKSFSIISAEFVKKFYSKITDKKLNFSQDKIIFCLFIIVGISLFKWFDP